MKNMTLSMNHVFVLQNGGRTENYFVQEEFTRMVVELLSVKYIQFNFCAEELGQRLF